MQWVTDGTTDRPVPPHNGTYALTDYSCVTGRILPVMSFSMERALRTEALDVNGIREAGATVSAPAADTTSRRHPTTPVNVSWLVATPWSVTHLEQRADVGRTSLRECLWPAAWSSSVAVTQYDGNGECSTHQQEHHGSGELATHCPVARRVSLPPRVRLPPPIKLHKSPTRATVIVEQVCGLL